jgi:hypothetical protein
MQPTYIVVAVMLQQSSATTSNFVCGDGNKTADGTKVLCG